MSRSAEFLYQDELEWTQVSAGVKRQILGYDKDIMLVKIAFEAGGVGTVHAHPHVQTSYVVSGKFEVEIDGKKQILSAGDGFYAASNVRHGVVCLEAGILIDSFNPVREDFLLLH